MPYDPFSNRRGSQPDPYGRRQSKEDYDQQEEEQDPRLGNAPRGQAPRGGLGGGLFDAMKGRLMIALVLGLMALIGYYTSTHKETNPVTDETKRLPWEPAQDVPLGLQAAPEMIRQHGGELPDPRLQRQIDEIGMRLVRANAVGDWKAWFEQFRWDFHLLADDQTVNAFALPGGQIFFTYGLYLQLNGDENAVAGVMGHEIGHVIARHSARQMAQSKLIGGLVMAGTTAASGGNSDPRSGQMIASMLSMKYGRDDELQSDKLGVQFMAHAGYDPEGLIKVMEVLAKISGGARQPEYLSSHPNPENRIEKIRQAIADFREKRMEGPKEAEVDSMEHYRGLGVEE